MVQARPTTEQTPQIKLSTGTSIVFQARARAKEEKRGSVAEMMIEFNNGAAGESREEGQQGRNPSRPGRY